VLKVAPSTVHRYLRRATTEARQENLLDAREAERVSPIAESMPMTEIEVSPSAEPDELCSAAPLAASTTEHATKYAGSLLLSAGLHALGVADALKEARAVRPRLAMYPPETIAMTLACAWGAGFGSLEAMHERDAHGLGVVLGLERCPSVRTLHRAIGQMSSTVDVTVLGRELMHGLRRSLDRVPTVFGIDGHFKAYSGKAPIDKGWDSKRRLASKGLLDIVVTDTRGRTWATRAVAAGSSLAQHVVEGARGLRRTLGESKDFVVAMDRGGFDFDVLNALDAEHFAYVLYIPDTVNLPALTSVAPAHDGIAEQPFVHPRLGHAARLMVERDGEDLIPVATNLGAAISADAAIRILRSARGMQENSFKAARQHAHIDRLNDRGVLSVGPDHRLVDNPEYREVRSEIDRLTEELSRLDACEARCETTTNAIPTDLLVRDLELAVAKKRLRELPARIARSTIEPNAKHAVLRTRNRALLLPLKYASDNSRRWCADLLGTALAPTEHDHDQSAVHRTLDALIKAPGFVRLGKNEVHVTIDLQLPPSSHARLAAALAALDPRNLRFSDGERPVRFRLATRVTRDRLGRP
jgi:hypothetical protein